MLFNSWEFLFLCTLTIALYYLPFRGHARKIWQVGLLLATSAVFYAWGNPKLLILLSASCLLNAIAVERILFWKNKAKLDRVHVGVTRPARQRAKHWLIATVALNLGFLAFFKYSGFFVSILPASFLAESVRLWLQTIPLPVGISFYTFQGISLVVDVWRNDISANTARSLSGRGRERVTAIRDVSFYVAFFPQLVAGPIVKAHEFVDQIGVKLFREIDWLTVRRCLVVGYFLKIFVADNLAEQTASLSLGAEHLIGLGPFNLLPLLYCYSLQIFADFAGYSLIAIGLGAVFGYKLPQNFNFPYLSTSITEFWRRWHLSLSTWLRDYLYFPLGGNRKGAGRTYFNLFLVMFLGGLWHGAAWKFALWGSLHGLFLALERLISRNKSPESRIQNPESRIQNPESRIQNPEPRIQSPKSWFWPLVSGFSKWFLTFHLVTLLWLTFLMPDMASIAAFFKGLLNGKTDFSGPPLFSLFFYGSAVVLYHLWGLLNEYRKHLASKLARSPIEPLLHGLLIFLVVTNPGAPRGFIYFQF